MKIFLYVALASVVYLTAQASDGFCPACDAVEDGAPLDSFKNFTDTQLSMPGRTGETPFYWSVYYNKRDVQDYLIKRLGKDTVVSQSSHFDLIETCAGSEFCKQETLQKLTELGFKSNRYRAPLLSLLMNSRCDIKKFETIAAQPEINFYYRDIEGNNLLHRLAKEATAGRPAVDIDCAAHIIQAFRKKVPTLFREKNKEGLTPLQLANRFAAKKEFGTGVEEIYPKFIRLLKK